LLSLSVRNCMFDHLVAIWMCFALQGFVSYLKSVVMASNKKLFDVTKLDLEPYAL
jgi:Domain of unknown function (DUF4217)